MYKNFYLVSKGNFLTTPQDMARISFMRQLVHNGVFIPPYEYKGLSIVVNGERVKLTPEQEEMAIAFAKQPPERLEDKVFVKNFLKDFFILTYFRVGVSER